MIAARIFFRPAVDGRSCVTAPSAGEDGLRGFASVQLPRMIPQSKRPMTTPINTVGMTTRGLMRLSSGSVGESVMFCMRKLRRLNILVEHLETEYHCNSSCQRPQKRPKSNFPEYLQIGL